VGVNAWGEKPEDVRAFVEKTGIGYPILLEGGDVSGLYGVEGAVPSTYAIDSEGRIAAFEPEYDGPEKLDGMIRALIAEKKGGT
jgi:hypothetical protein